MSYTYKYPHMAVTVDAVLFAVGEGEAKVLLIERANEPFKGRWALPGGYVDMTEQVADAAARELLEETTISGVELNFLGYFDEIDRDPRERSLSLAFWGTVNGDDVNPQAADDASDARWFPISQLPALAFDHQDILDTAIAKLRSVKTTTI